MDPCPPWVNMERLPFQHVYVECFKQRKLALDFAAWVTWSRRPWISKGGGGLQKLGGEVLKLTSIDYAKKYPEHYYTRWHNQICPAENLQLLFQYLRTGIATVSALTLSVTKSE